VTDLLQPVRKSYRPPTPVVIAAATVASAAGVLAGPPATAIPGGLLLGFVLPGLALHNLIFRNRRQSAVERTVLAPALSLATLIVAGLGLYVAGFALDRSSWTLGVAGVTLAVLGLTAVPERVWLGEEEEEEDDEPADAATEIIPAIRDGAPPPNPVPPNPVPPNPVPPKPVPPNPVPPNPVPPGPFAPPTPRPKVRTVQLVRQLTPMVLVVAILVGAGYLSYVSSNHNYDVTVTTLSAAPPGPSDAAGERVVTVTASGLVAADGPYTVIVTEPDGTRLGERQVPVDADGTWQAALRLPAAERLTVRLFRAGDIVAYRTLYLAAEE
jgi:hypothetical protein